MKTFKELNREIPLKKKVKKAGLSLAIIFSKEECRRFGIEYDDEIVLDEACLLKKNENSF